MAGLPAELKAFAIGLGLAVVLLLGVRWLMKRWIEREADRQSS